MQVSCHLVDEHVPMYPAGTERLHRAILPTHTFTKHSILSLCFVPVILFPLFFCYYNYYWPWRQGGGSPFQQSFVKDFLQGMFLPQSALYEKQIPAGQIYENMWNEEGKSF